MAKKAKSAANELRTPIKKRTSIGDSTRSHPKNKHATHKRYRGQGKP